jgi:peptidoglycan glycosyltransferase
MTVTPLHLALAAAALANDGRMPAPLLITAEQDTAGAWQPMDPISHPIAALPPEFAQEVKALLGGGYSAASVSSASGGSLAWFLGFAPIENSEYAIAVLLEDGDTAQARIIGRRVLQAALDHAR